MLGNITLNFLADVANPSTVTIAPNASADVTLTVPGANPDTDSIVNVEVAPDSMFDIGVACLVAAWVSSKNTVKLRYFNLIPNTTSLNILTGKIFTLKISRCDNGFIADGL